MSLVAFLVAPFVRVCTFCIANARSVVTVMSLVLIMWATGAVATYFAWKSSGGFDSDVFVPRWVVAVI